MYFKIKKKSHHVQYIKQYKFLNVRNHYLVFKRNLVFFYIEQIYSLTVANLDWLLKINHNDFFSYQNNKN